MFPRGDFMGTMGRVENVLRTRRMEVSHLHLSLHSFHSLLIPSPALHLFVSFTIISNTIKILNLRLDL
jgi:hypothetical protein